jgi:DNA-binding NarL/FixJ family response regulator
MTHSVHVPPIEGNPADAELACETMLVSKMEIELSIAKDGVEAIAFLTKKGSYKGGAPLKTIPVVIPSASEADNDVVGAPQFGANRYVSKPVDLRTDRSIVRVLEDFWLSVVKRPPCLGHGAASGGRS